MSDRADLHDILEAILLDVEGTRNVYFQPPATVKMVYPCIVYSRSDPKPAYADDILYMDHQGYQIMVIDKDPDSEIPGMVAKLPLCKFVRHYTTDNLNHDVYRLYYKGGIIS